MKPLTKREKILLYALAIVAMIAGMVVLVIQPAMQQSETLDADIIEKQMSVDTVRAAIRTQQSLQDEIAGNEAGIAEESKYFFPFMTNNELDEYITGLLQTHGLTALSLAISTGGSKEDGAEEETVQYSDIQRFTVNTTARGTMRQFMLLVDTVKELDGIRIVGITNKQDEVVTPAPTATPKPSRRAKATPAPLFATPAQAAKEDTYTMDIAFSVLEYVDGASTSVTLDRED